MLLDTNILIYSMKSGGEHLLPFVSDPKAVVSIVTRIEALGYPKISHEDEDALNAAFDVLPEVELNAEIAMCAIELRRLRRMNLADAVIAATAVVNGMPLVTRNVKDFKHIPELQIINPFTA